MVEAVSACQDSDCSIVIVWTKNGGKENNWGVWADTGEIETGYELRAGIETECQRQPTDEERAAILAALEDWKAIGNWDNNIPWMTRALLKSPGGKQRAFEIALEYAAKAEKRPPTTEAGQPA